jgi:hypothetical protein
VFLIGQWVLVLELGQHRTELDSPGRAPPQGVDRVFVR